MVTTAEEPTPVTREERAETVARMVIAGHPAGAVRRIILWMLTFALIGVGFYVPYVLVLAIVTALMLALTDSLL